MYEYDKNELEASLKRAFIGGKADFIIVDGHTLRNKFLREGLQLGLENGLLSQGKDIDEDDLLGKGMGQYLAHTYRLTDKGKEYFNLK